MAPSWDPFQIVKHAAERSGAAFAAGQSAYGEEMLTLQGHYHVAPNKRLTILAEFSALPKGTLETDIEALGQACARDGGRCEVQVRTQHGPMLGTLVERRARRFDLRLFEGYLAFPPRA